MAAGDETRVGNLFRFALSLTRKSRSSSIARSDYWQLPAVGSSAGVRQVPKRLTSQSERLTRGATVTIAASDASGSSLVLPGGDSSGMVVAAALTPNEPFASGSLTPPSLTSAFDASAMPNLDAARTGFGASSLGNLAVGVPEPSALVLVLLALSSVVGVSIARPRYVRRNGP